MTQQNLTRHRDCSSKWGLGAGTGRQCAGAYAYAADFANDNVVTHAQALAGKPVRIATGNDDSFYPGVVAMAHAAPKSVEVTFGPGCHTNAFFEQQQHPSLVFPGEHLARS